MLILWGAIACLGLHAQTYPEIDLSEFAYSVSWSSGNWSAGDTVTFGISLGDEEHPAENVVGIRLDLSLHEETGIPNNLGVSIAGSWCFDPANVTIDPDVNISAPELSLLLVRTNYSSTSGDGLLFTFQLLVNMNGLKSSEMIADIDGVVIVENVDARMAAPQPTVVPNVIDNPTLQHPIATERNIHSYPNPAHDRLQLPVHMEADMQAWLIAADGRRYPLAPMLQHDHVSFDVSDFPVGVYQLLVLQGDKVVAQDRVIKI